MAQSPAQPAEHVVTALRLGPGDAIRLDGVLDEAVWARAAVAAVFFSGSRTMARRRPGSTEVRRVAMPTV